LEKAMATSASLEIHIINVSQGDCVLVVNRDVDAVGDAIKAKKMAIPKDRIDWVPFAVSAGVPLQNTVKKALLVDGGDGCFGGSLVKYLDAYGAIDPKAVNGYQQDLTVLASHYHDDHFAGLGGVFAQRVTPKRKGDKTTYKVLCRPAVFVMDARSHTVVPKGPSFVRFQSQVANAMKSPGLSTELIELLPGGLRTSKPSAKPYEIDLGAGVSGIPIIARVVASGQQIWRPVGKPVDVKSVEKKIDYNDRSVVLMVEYGSFRCLLGGDIAGNGGAAGGNTGPGIVPPPKPGDKKYRSKHADVESQLEPILRELFPKTPKPVPGKPKFQEDGYATVLKANHHGSNTSVDTHLLATVQPLVFVISSGVKARPHNHPTAEVIYRVDTATTWNRNDMAKTPVKNTIKGIYVTEVGDVVRGEKFTVSIPNGMIVGTTVVRPTDESIDAIQQAKAFGQPLEVQVYGVGVSTDLTHSSSSVRKLQKGNAPGAAYPIGPWWHQDTH
jgi:hypothetical protein